MRRAGDIALTVTSGLATGILIGYLLGFTHGTPTADNASPPPEAFDYPFGIFVGLVLASLGRFARPTVWRLMHRGPRERRTRRL